MSGLWAYQAPGVDPRLDDDTAYWAGDDMLYAVEIPVEVTGVIRVHILAGSHSEAERRAREVFPRLRFISSPLFPYRVPEDVDQYNTELVIFSVRRVREGDKGFKTSGEVPEAVGTGRVTASSFVCSD